MKIKLDRNAFSVTLALYFVCFLNVPFWSEVFKIIQLDNASDLIYLASAFITLSAIFTVLFNLILFPYLGKIFILILALVALFAGYHMHHFKVVISADMMRNVLQTDIHESIDLLCVKFGIWFCFLALPLILLLCFVKINYQPKVLAELKSRLRTIIVSIVLIALSVGLAYKNIVVIHRNHRNLTGLVTPINCFYCLGKLIKQQNRTAGKFTKIGLDAAKGQIWKNVTKKSLLIIVVGEAARSDHFSLNGYARETNPLLKTKNVISLKNVSSCDTSTAAAVPGIFSELSHSNYTPEKAAQQENLLDVLARVGFSIFWRDNNSSSKGVASRLKEENVRALDQNDEILLKGLDDYIKNLNTDAVIVLHQLGSHGPAYYKRYPSEFNKYKPGCETNEIQSCRPSDLINTYDNTILYTDYILAKLIELLEKNEQLNTAMLYISDHGQSLGEYGLYLHGTPYLVAPKEQTHIPWIIWLSDGFVKEFKINMSNLKEKAETGKYAHENFFHSVLGLLNISTQTYDQKLDIFKD